MAILQQQCGHVTAAKTSDWYRQMYCLGNISKGEGVSHRESGLEAPAWFPTHHLDAACAVGRKTNVGSQASYPRQVRL